MKPKSNHGYLLSTSAYTPKVTGNRVTKKLAPYVRNVLCSFDIYVRICVVKVGYLVTSYLNRLLPLNIEVTRGRRSSYLFDDRHVKDVENHVVTVVSDIVWYMQQTPSPQCTRALHFAWCATHSAQRAGGYRRVDSRTCPATRSHMTVTTFLATRNLVSAQEVSQTHASTSALVASRVAYPLLTQTRMRNCWSSGQFAEWTLPTPMTNQAHTLLATRIVMARSHLWSGRRAHQHSSRTQGQYAAACAGRGSMDRWDIFSWPVYQRLTSTRRHVRAARCIDANMYRFNSRPDTFVRPGERRSKW